jgi:signal transduction histidine kinase/DNA-binding response OmpR family regulator
VKTIRLLLVEDSRDDATLLVREFEREGYDVYTRRVETESALREALSAERWDAVIADHAMPRLDSLRALAILRDVAPEVPVIIVSGVIGEETAVLAMKHGAADYVMKSNLRRLVAATEREVRDACELANDVRERKRLEGEQQLVSDASRVLSASIDWDDTMASVAHFLTQSFASWCVISVLEPDGVERFTTASVAAASGSEKRELLEAFRLAPCPALERALGRAPTELVTHVSDEWAARNFTHPAQLAIARRLGIESLIMVPLRARKRVVGAIMLVSSSPHRPFDERAALLAEDLAQRAALCVDNARLYREAQSAVRAREEFVAVAAHDLRSPLSALSVAVQSLTRMIRRQSPREQIEALLTVIERSVGRVARLTDDLLDMTRLGVGKLRLDLETVDLEKVVRDAADEAARLPGASRVVVVMAEHHTLLGRWDRKRLEQLLANILSNAVKYGAGKPIEVVLSGDDESASLEVRDHGIGISPESQRRIFGRFERATTERAGLGLGLYIAHEIARLLGGRIEVSSMLGEGSTFTIILPRSGPRLSELSEEARVTVH